jgi:cytochrome bd-type quinol oxidase subunit 2
MPRGSTIFLQAVIVLVGIAALALLLWEPHIEGVNANAKFFEVYLDPFIAFVYIGSIPFFAALYQAIKALGYARQNRVFSPEAVKALRTIKYCALAIIGFVVTAEIVIMSNRGSDDIAGGVFMGILITFGSVVVATAASIFERILQQAVDMKSGSDLTA